MILSLLESVLQLIHGVYLKNNEGSMRATCVFWVSYMYIFFVFLAKWWGTVLSKLRQSVELQRYFRFTSSRDKVTQWLSQYLLCGPNEFFPAPWNIQVEESSRKITHSVQTQILIVKYNQLHVSANILTSGRMRKLKIKIEFEAVWGIWVPEPWVTFSFYFQLHHQPDDGYILAETCSWLY